MKFVPFRNSEKFPTAEVIRGVATATQKGVGVKYDEIIKRGRIIDALTRCSPDGVCLEDADHAHLVGLIKGFDFATADTELRDVLIDIVEAKEPPPARAVA